MSFCMKALRLFLQYGANPTIKVTSCTMPIENNLASLESSLHRPGATWSLVNAISRCFNQKYREVLYGELDNQDRIDIWLGVYTMLNMSCDLKSHTVSSATVGAHLK
jgi:hypothetical protein